MNSLTNCVPTHHESRLVFNIPRPVNDSPVAPAERSGLCVLLKGISVARSPFNHAAALAGGDVGIRCFSLCKTAISLNQKVMVIGTRK